MKSKQQPSLRETVKRGKKIYEYKVKCLQTWRQCLPFSLRYFHAQEWEKTLGLYIHYQRDDHCPTIHHILRRVLLKHYSIKYCKHLRVALLVSWYISPSLPLRRENENSRAPDNTVEKVERFNHIIEWIVQTNWRQYVQRMSHTEISQLWNYWWNVIILFAKMKYLSIMPNSFPICYRKFETSRIFMLRKNM